MTGRLHRLHRERDSARKRVDYCRAELALEIALDQPVSRVGGIDRIRSRDFFEHQDAG